MSTTSQQAERECVTLFKDAATAAFASYPQHYDGVESNDPPTDQCWFRWTFQHTDSNQASLSCEHGERRWRREGFIIVQCFGLLDAGGKTVAQRMAEVCRDAYEGIETASGVWFRRATTMEVGRDGRFYQVNASIQFLYDEVR